MRYHTMDRIFKLQNFAETTENAGEFFIYSNINLKVKVYFKMKWKIIKKKENKQMEIEIARNTS